MNCEKLQAQSTKSQINSKFQIPNGLESGHWDLGLVILSLIIVAWSFIILFRKPILFLFEYSMSTLITAIIFSSIGLAYFVYGKKQCQPVPLVIGILLMVYPYFIPGLLASI